MLASAPMSESDKCMYLTLRCGIKYETGWVEWCEEAIASFQSSSIQD